MSSKKSYIKYAKGAFYEPQSYYLASGSSLVIFDELRKLGSKRVLFVCNKTVSEYRNFTDLVAVFEKNGYRSFKYIRKDGSLNTADIVKGLSIYREYNCDTIVTVGGAADVDCGKMISAMQTNNLSDPMELVGLDKFKNDISVLCCIVTDNSVNAATSSAEFFDEATGKLKTSFSAYYIPQIVVIDTDIAMRTDINITLDQALTALGIAIESYISPIAASFPAYRANSIDACRTLFKYIDLMMEFPDESYYRRRVAVGSLYAGLSSRMTGLGISHIATHSLMSKYGEVRSCLYLYILTQFLSETDDEGLGRIAELARETGVAHKLSDNKESLDLLMQKINIYLGYYSAADADFSLSTKEINSLISSIIKEIDVFGFDSRIKGTLERILSECSMKY